MAIRYASVPPNQICYLFKFEAKNNNKNNHNDESLKQLIRKVRKKKSFSA